MPIYDNAWLNAREAKRKLGTTIEPSVPKSFNADSEDYGDDPVAAAKAFLARPSVMTPTAAEEAETVRRTTAPRQRGSLKNFLDAMKMGGSLGLEAIEQSPREEVGPIARTAAGIAKYASPLYAVPAALSGLRQLIAPERSGSVIVPDEESRMGGALELGGGILSAGGMAVPRAGANMARVAQQAEEAKGIVPEVVNIAREAVKGGASRKQAAQRAGWPLGKSAEVPYRRAPSAAVELPAQSRPSLRALDELSTPGASRYVDEQFTQNNPLARRILGNQVGAPYDAQAAADDILSRMIGPEEDLSPLMRASEQAKRLRALGESRRTGRPLREEF